jgi:hypothetical protein
LFAYFRLDFMSVLFATLALLWLARGRQPSGFVVLGVLAKLWPVTVLAGSAWRGRWRDVVLGLTASLVLIAVWYAFSPSGFRAFLEFRRGTGFHVESLIGSIVLLAGGRPVFRSGAWVVAPGRWGWVDPVLVALWAALVVIVVVRARGRGASDAGVIGALVIALMLLSRLLSPQYLVWAVPFLALARADGERRATGLFVLAACVTPGYLWGYKYFLQGNPALQGLVVGRNLLLAVTAVLLLRWALSPARR